MPLNYFIGKSQAWLEEQLSSAQADAASGKTTTSVTTSDLSTGKVIEVDVGTRIERLLYALYLLDPITYPLNQIRRVTRTKAIFS
jgi:hypothetical protein